MENIDAGVAIVEAKKIGEDREKGREMVCTYVDGKVRRGGRS